MRAIKKIVLAGLCALCIALCGCIETPGDAARSSNAPADSTNPSAGAVDSNSGKNSNSEALVSEAGNQVVENFSPRLGKLWSFEAVGMEYVEDADGNKNIVVEVAATNAYDSVRKLSSLGITMYQGETELEIGEAVNPETGVSYDNAIDSLPEVNPGETYTFTLCRQLVSDTDPVRVSFGGYLAAGTEEPVFLFEVA